MSPDQKIGDMIIFSDVAPFFVKIANFKKFQKLKIFLKIQKMPKTIIFWSRDTVDRICEHMQKTASKLKKNCRNELIPKLEFRKKSFFEIFAFKVKIHKNWAKLV